MSEPLETIRQSPMRRLMGVRIIGTGSYLPELVVTNDELASKGFDADWILQRTGIRERRHAPANVATSDLAVQAAERCLAAAGIPHDEIDLLILATLSPDHLMPQTATAVQHQLGLNCPAVDVSAACAGFMYAMVMGMQFVATGCSRRALIIGADMNSRVTDPADFKVFPLFGDGAGAALLAPGSPEQGLLAYTLGANGAGIDLLYRPGGVRPTPEVPQATRCMGYMQMDGRPVFKWAVRLLEESPKQVLQAAGSELADVKLWILHQANARILDAAVESLGLERERVVMHLDRYGNTSAGSIPIALDESLRAGRIRAGDQILLCGFGGGLSWGTALMRW
jgi:3-oxoacyl-[acyl-carrier-protein] synthase-3